MQKPVTLGTICLNSTDDRERNFSKALALVDKAAERGCDWILLPELFSYMGPYDKLWDNAFDDSSPEIRKLSDSAKKHGVVLFAGSVGERPATDVWGEWEGKKVRRIYNTSYVFGRNGETLAKYRKIHLFNLKDGDGRKLYCESDGFLPGDAVSSITVDGYRVGLCICYDLRFSGMFQKMQSGPLIDVLVAPSAFTLQTGMDHWELLLRSRAVENQCYVFSANQTGVHSPGKQSYGHSMVIDPWGHALCDTGDSEGFAQTIMDPARIAFVRGRLPVLNNLRADLYI